MIRVYLSGDPVHDRVLRAFAEGCNGQLVEGWQYEPSAVAVIFGVYKSRVPKSFPRGEIFRRQRDKNLDVVVLETGYINRGDGENHHYAAGFNGLNGRADFRNQEMPDDRVKKLAVGLGAWREGNYILLCGQIPWDASCENSDHNVWLQASAERLKGYSSRPIKYRPHPLLPAQFVQPIDGVELSTAPLVKDLADAHCVVTYNSNTGVDALLAGVPVFAHDQGSMVWSLANRSLISVDVPNRPDRSQWLSDLCYAQWTLDEMRSGETWRHLVR